MKEKILLALMPFWTPQIPPLGITCLKSFLRPYGYEVKTLDLNTENRLRKIYNEYFDALREQISEEKRGNFYNIGHEVLQNHLMAYLNYEDEEEYIKLVKILIFKTFFFDANRPLVLRLHETLTRFYNWLEEYFLDLLEKERPSVLGLSVYKGNLPASMFAFKRTRETYPHIKTVMGGAVFAQTLGPGTPDFEYFLQTTKDYIDKIIIGEGEVLFLRLLEGELPDSRRVFSRQSPDNDNHVVELSTVDIPDFSDLDLTIYPNLASYTSRSCPYQCRFCTETVYWGKYRKKTPKQVVEELLKLYRRHRFQLFLMCDSLLNPIITGLARELIDADTSIYWDGYLRVDKDSCNPDMAMLWRRGGFYRARVGVESGSQEVLESMGKKVKIGQIRATLTALAHAGIKTTTYWIIGYPGETEADFQLTLDLIEEMKDDIYEAECNPFGYYLTGQVGSDEWAGKNIPLYPPDAQNMLILQTWIMDCEPGREEMFKRVSRFVDHCSKLGIANPYSLYDISKADERWQKLHQIAVPPLLKFRDKDSYLNENKYVKPMAQARNKMKGAVEFGF